jgi:type IV secretory pathway VirB10-like protein
VREILAARSDRDFVRAGPRRQSASAETSVGRRVVAGVLQRPALLAGSLAIATAATAIVVNALSYQSARHPSPMFGKVERVTPASRPAEPATPVLPPVPPTRPPSVTTTAALPPPAPRSTARDPIADLIRGSETTGSASPPARPLDSRPEAQPQVAAAQRALAKLGYGPLKTDGIFGQGTRQAIERFERDRRLTPTGELGPRTVRELSAQSGLRVD